MKTVYFIVSWFIQLIKLRNAAITKIKYIGLLSSLLILQSCMESGTKEEVNQIQIITVPVFEEIELKSIDSFQLGDKAVNLWQWKLINDKIVARVSGEDHLLYIYSFPDFKLLYKYGRKGKSPGEYLSANWGQTQEKDAVILYDINKKSLFNLQVQEDSIRVKETYLLYGEIEGNPGISKPFTMIQHLNDGVFLMKVDDPETTALEIIDLKNPQLLSSYPIKFENRSRETGYPPFNFNVSFHNNTLVLGYEYMNRIEFYRIRNDNQIEPTLVIGDDKDQAHISDEEQQEYYTRLLNDGKYVYLANQFSGGGNSPVTSIEVYTLDGTPVKRVKLDRQIGEIVLDSKTNKMYTYTQEEEADFIHVYDFGFYISNQSS